MKEELRQRAGEEKSRILTGILYEGTPCEAGNALFETVYPLSLIHIFIDGRWILYDGTGS